MANRHSVTDNGDLRKYYAAIPNIVFKLGLNPFEFTLYSYLKQAAGDTGGACWKSRATIARESGMSSGMVTKARQALERPRLELNGRPLITVTDEPSKSGGKPTCRVTITDIWTVNMSKSSTSPHDVAPSPYDVEVEAPSLHDQRRHHTTLATSPHDLKEEPKKKNQEEVRELSAHSRLMDFLATKIGHIPNGAKEGKAIKWLLTHGYDPLQCEQCFESLASEDWRTSAVTWTTVQSQIGAWLNRRNGNGTNQKRSESGAERSARNLRENAEYIRGLQDSGGESDREDPIGLLASGF